MSLKTIFCVLVFVLTANTYASDSSFEEKKKLVILEEIQNAIEKDFKLEGSIKKVVIEPEKKDLPPLDDKNGNRSGPVTPTPIKKPLIANKEPTKAPTPSAGQSKIQAMLEQNRQRLKERQANDKKNQMNAMMSKRSSSAENNEDWMDSKLAEIDKWEEEKKKEIEVWQEEKKKLLAKWLEEKGKYIKRIPEYKKNLPPIPKEEVAPVVTAPTPSPLTPSTKNTPTPPPISTATPLPTAIVQEIKMPVFEDYHVIDSAFFAETKDQGKRPTCASFAGVRAIEILLARQQDKNRLSEQYFFWASKPKCQSSPCPQQGSWVLAEFQQSKKSSRPDIPKSSDCPYNASGNSNNVTLTPLSESCQRGYAKVVNFSEIRSSAEIISALKNNTPVIAGFKLSESFYNNNGYVFINNPEGKSATLDSHAEGHALLLVGYMKLPPKLHSSEGTFCLITANSWGIGWGKGGHACLSENWIKKYRYDMPFIALEKISTGNFY
ncbi:MAG: hypothetical protein A2504_02970 [Bdellovibrionales bacterium RIFOXYD12_FULL_39_22]|nr:MAG: hypothetical protein A2385_05685 [Bdellovibrionales bacterium RIFOXYB1_FULL_39_21]OFZ42244.1 MAG: hypothetical protein A2485_15715 [Bdellovibrionales bacterium RIFOXYC12_FULL_39_17]OFZ46664.1 MAG: hypothetical protein A2404_03955 [Bdellovibrionales bacterium RIFOXYC1_FULL_39_130]OFZ76059.1 MAG: hypothetical protein A2560_03195 [Bdellovibrionales bacterium RIFOXYD1_FULL_39_84]OFZ93043.1 MAG: hypothetical protein A2504_02970 [Bdellovibrionales bacterium RIFOXYD12_FULL_39_22]HLE09937.1 C1